MNNFQKVTDREEYVLFHLLNACAVHIGDISALDSVLLEYHKNPF